MPRPCPFCGSDADWDIAEYDGFYVICRKCGAYIGPRASAAAAVEAWNARAVDADALLAIADDMEDQCTQWSDCGKHYAPLIRKAVGA